MRVLVEVLKRVPPTSTTTRSTSRRLGVVVSSVAGDPAAGRLRDIERADAGLPWLSPPTRLAKLKGR